MAEIVISEFMDEAAVDRLRARYDVSYDPTLVDDPARLAAILRRTALAAYPRVTVASLSGQEWLQFLDAQVGGTAFSTGAGRGLAREPYRPNGPDPQLRPLVADWIRKHRGGPA